MIDLTKFDKGFLDHLGEGVYIVDSSRKILFWSRGAELMTGYLKTEVEGAHCWNNIMRHVNDAGENMCTGLCPLAKAVLDGSYHETTAFLHHKDGHRVPVFIKTIPIRDASGNITGAAEIFTDISSTPSLQTRIHELESMAMVDALTGLTNRRYMEMTLQARIYQVQRYEWSHGLLFMDIDNFKQVNDTYGHDMGDAVLRLVARTMLSNARASDMPGRWGGEEFTVIADNAAAADLPAIADRYRLLIGKSSVRAGDAPLSVTVSVGATIIRADDTVESLVKRADSLMYQSKRSGKNTVTVG